jgi:phage FluMu protein Com
MEMTTCYVCGKVIGKSTGEICPQCRKLLDVIYEKARTYLRDNPKEKLDALELAEALGEDERLIQLLAMEGRFSGEDNDGKEEDEEEKKRQQLLAEIEKSLSNTVKKGITTYGADRYGKERPGKDRPGTGKDR